MFVFPKQRKEPLTDAAHVKNVLARFDQVQDVIEEDPNLRRQRSIMGFILKKKVGMTLVTRHRLMSR